MSCFDLYFIFKTLFLTECAGNWVRREDKMHQLEEYEKGSRIKLILVEWE